MRVAYALRLGTFIDHSLKLWGVYEPINNFKIFDAVELMLRLVYKVNVLVKDVLRNNAHKAFRIIVAVLLINNHQFYLRYLHCKMA